MSEDLAAWVGSTEVVEDRMTLWPARALGATLDLSDPGPGEGDPLPPLWHWLYFLPTVAHSGLGPEGHARLGGFLPPVPLPRRMFAGGRFTFHRPLHIGERATRTGTVVGIEEKTGRSGRLFFVVVRYEVVGEDGLSIVEEQDLVYREPSAGNQSPEPGTESIPAAPWARVIVPDSVMLFRFSALTFNAHRIHYDQPYATQVEGYPGIVVHGPMVALLLADLAHRNGPAPLGAFSFRARSPLYANGPVTFVGEPGADGWATLAAWSHDGRCTVTARAKFTHKGSSDPGTRPVSKP